MPSGHRALPGSILFNIATATCPTGVLRKPGELTGTYPGAQCIRKPLFAVGKLCYRAAGCTQNERVDNETGYSPTLERIRISVNLCLLYLHYTVSEINCLLKAVQGLASLDVIEFGILLLGDPEHFNCGKSGWNVCCECAVFIGETFVSVYVEENWFACFGNVNNLKRGVFGIFLEDIYIMLLILC